MSLAPLGGTVLDFIFSTVGVIFFLEVLVGVNVALERLHELLLLLPLLGLRSVGELGRDHTLEVANGAGGERKECHLLWVRKVEVESFVVGVAERRHNRALLVERDQGGDGVANLLDIREELGDRINHEALGIARVVGVGDLELHGVITFGTRCSLSWEFLLVAIVQKVASRVLSLAQMDTQHHNDKVTFATNALQSAVKEAVKKAKNAAPEGSRIEQQRILDQEKGDYNLFINGSHIVKGRYKPLPLPS